MLRWIFLTLCLVYTASSKPQSRGGWYTYVHKYPSGVTELRPEARELSECVIACANSQRRCYGATFDFNTANCRLHTDLIQACFRPWIRDNSSRGKKTVHVSNTVCNRRKQYNAIEGAAKNLNGSTCTNQAVRRFNDTNSPGGVMQSGITTEIACLVFCLNNAACWGVDFDTNSNTCWLHSTAAALAVQTSFVGVVQYQKICPTVLTNVFATSSTTTASTATTPTTRPTAASPIIGEDGICPSPFEALANTTQGAPGTGTVQVATVNTTELCKRACLTDATCMAADFNTVTNLCFFHTAVSVTTLMRGTQSCCIHYRKINCVAMMMRQCWSQTVTTAAGPLIGQVDTAYVGDGSNAMISMIPCTGVCFYRQVTTLTAVNPPMASRVTTRGCDTTSPFQTPVSCSSDVTTGATAGTVGAITTSSYTCSDSLCNIFTQIEARDQLLYLPFDNTLEDHGAYMRNGYFWNWTMGTFSYDAFDKQKNKSALFSGNEMVCTPLNNINLNPASPEVTFTSFVKREGTAPAVMGIFSKGTTNTKANTTELFKLTSTFQSPDMHIYTFTLNLDQQYSCSITSAVPINMWQFVAARVRVVFTPVLGGFIDLFVIPEAMFGATTATTLMTPTMSCPLTGAAAAVLHSGLNVTGDPFCVGGTYVNENFTPIQGTTNFFTGHIDEVRVFRNALTEVAPINAMPIFSVFSNRD